MTPSRWHDLGAVETLGDRPLRQLAIGRAKIALVHIRGEFAAVSGVCNHAGGPIGEGRLDGEYLVCPWHNWKYHWKTGKGEPGFEADALPTYDLDIRDGRLWINLEPATKRGRAPHEPHPLARKIVRAPGGVRVVGISTTAMDSRNPRVSTSDLLLDEALEYATTELGLETRRIRLNDLRFRPCEGYYSKSAHACTWPCSITQMDPEDQLDRVYDAVVHWADVIMVATPIRWGAASSLFYKMAERMNCIQNQITIANRVLLRNKVASFIITGGQDNVQAVAGHLLGFFGEIGCVFPQFPYIAHSRGWSAEDMENNVRHVAMSAELREGARELLRRAAEMAQVLIERDMLPDRAARGGRKAHHMAIQA